jgi:S-disulfanyl-L-cysteine oxidoreductase SoxD
MRRPVRVDPSSSAGLSAANMRRSLTMIRAAAVFLAVLSAGPVAAQTHKTVWDGVFTAEQAARGKTIFATNCAACHAADLSGANGPVLKGEVFLNHWMEGSLDALFTKVKSMPQNRANLGDIAYVDLLAFLLDANAFPAAAKELNAEAIPIIQVQGKNGPAPVPSFALVDVVGCFARGSNDTWMLTNGSEPARTRSPMQPTESEIAAAKAKPLGSQTFQLLDAEYFSNAFHPEAHAGHKVNAKGFLMRTGADVKINVTWVEMLAADCGR